MDNTINNINTVDNEIISISQAPKKRGRPAKKLEEKRTRKFNLVMYEDIFIEVNKIAAREQLISGKRTSATAVINNIVENYIKKIKEEKKSEDVHAL